jgi:hypothetical protein
MIVSQQHTCTATSCKVRPATGPHTTSPLQAAADLCEVKIKLVLGSKSPSATTLADDRLCESQIREMLSMRLRSCAAPPGRLLSWRNNSARSQGPQALQSRAHLRVPGTLAIRLRTCFVLPKNLSCARHPRTSRRRCAEETPSLRVRPRGTVIPRFVTSDS